MLVGVRSILGCGPCPPPRVLRSPRGSELTCKGWVQEAALRMLLNNLDPEVAERPQDLVVYGGTGKAARNWECFEGIVRELRALEGDETLLVQSGKAVGRLRTHPDAPRVLIANSNLVPKWATWDEFRRLEAAGLTMYGQMTAGSWIYIGTQGILQGTYETFVAARRAYRDRNPAPASAPGCPLWVLTAGLGGMGGAQPLAATMAGMSCLAVEVDPSRIEKRLATRYVDERIDDLDAALARLDAAVRDGRPVSVGLCGNAAEIFPELVRRAIVPDLVTEQTAAHDPLIGYVPLGLSLAEAAELRAEDPDGYVERAKASMAEEVSAMLWMKARGAEVFDYGNNLRACAREAGCERAFEIPGFVPAYIRPLFCAGKGPFRWVALSGDPGDIAATDEAVLAAVPDDADLRAWIDLARARVAFQGLPARICWLGYGDPGPGRAGVQRARSEPGGVKGASRHRSRSPRLRERGVALPRDGSHERRVGRHRRLAAPQRHGQYGRRRELGQPAPWRGRRHRPEPARRHGRRRRRDARSRSPPGASADHRPGHGRIEARRCRVRRGALVREGARRSRALIEARMPRARARARARHAFRPGDAP